VSTGEPIVGVECNTAPSVGGVPRDGVAPAASHVDVVDERTQVRVLRALLWTFIALTGGILATALVIGSVRGTVIPAVGGVGFGLLLLALPEWGSRRVGGLCTLWYFLLATAAMASGRGIHDVSMVLYPAGMFMGALLLRQAHLVPLVVLTVATVAAVGAARVAELGMRPGAAGAAAEVVVVCLLLLVAGALTRLVVRSLQAMLSERRRAAEALRASTAELEARNEALELVNELAHRLHRGLDIEGIATETVDLMIRHSQPPMVAFYLLDEGGDRLRMVADHGFTDRERALGAILPVEGSLSGLAVRQQRLVESDHFGSDERAVPGVREALAARGVSTALSVPLAFGGSAFGTVNLIYARPPRLGPVDLDTFRAIGQAVALAISNARRLAGLEHQAYHDALTGLPNRSSLHRRFPALLAREGEGTVVGVLLLNLNRFREFNEALGHNAADRLLVQIASRLVASGSDHGAEVFRLGADEFAVLLPGLDGPLAAEAESLELLAALRQPFEMAGMALEVGGSVGVAVYPEHGLDSHQLLRCADVAMYRAKESAGGVALYARDLDHNTPERLAMVSELGAAIRDGRMTLHFQPKVALESGQVVGFEALVRWPHPSRGLLPPAEFLPMAESSDLIHPLTYWVVETALEQLQRWHALCPDLTMAVNLSARNLLDRNCPQRLEEIMRRVGVDPSRVEVELTETAVMADADSAQTMLGRITSTGARLAIDDFGTGYSSLAYLQRFPVHGIKIDRSFVADLATGEHSRAIVRSTVELARALGLSVVAEGIEDRDTADVLREMGCDLAQGYYFARPAPAEEVELPLDRGGRLPPPLVPGPR